MEDAGFILGSYALTFGAVALFAWRTIRSGKRLAELVTLVDETDRNPLPDPIERCLREQRPVRIAE